MHRAVAVVLLLPLLLTPALARGRGGWQGPYQLLVLPREDRHVTDPVTGVDLHYLTTGPSRDRNLYFHQRSWTSDESLLIFTSDRPQTGGTMAYLWATGELVQLATDRGGVGGATCSTRRGSVFAWQGRDVIEMRLQVTPAADPARRSQVTATWRTLATLAEGEGFMCDLAENCTSEWLAIGLNTQADGPAIDLVNVRTTERRRLTKGYPYAGHLQWSHTNPNLLSVAGMHNRLVVIDTKDGVPREYHQKAKEYITHESWWVGDQMIFCGGFRDKESDVKSLDVHTGQVRIVGAGAWVPWANNEDLLNPLPPDEDRLDADDILNRWNWWHCAGDEQGRWIAADNWWGDVAIIDGRTTQLHRLTLGHRPNIRGEHLEVGWDRSGRKVVFNSMLGGSADVVVATLPDRWPAVDPLADDDPVVSGLTPRSAVKAAGQYAP